MSLVNYALTTLARIKVFIGISNDAYDTVLTNLINAATDFIEKYCDRRFKLTTYANEVYDGMGSDILLLKQYPVKTFTSLEERDSADNQSSFSTIAAEDYFVKTNSGIIHYVGGFFERLPQHYRANYTAGYDYDLTATFLEDVKAGDLEYVCWKLVTKIFNERKANTNAQSESLGNYSVSYRKEAMADLEIKDILDKYKRPAARI